MVFSCLCSYHVNHFFHLDQLNESSRQASNHRLRAFEAPRLPYAGKKTECFTSNQLGTRSYWERANDDIKKGKFAIIFLLNGPEVWSPASNRVKFFLDIVSKNSNVDDSDICLHTFLFNAQVA